MLDLYALSADLRQPRSPCSLAAVSIIADIDAFLKRPGPKTALLAELWRADFRLIYGDVSANLSGNRRLDPAVLLARYGLDPADGEGEAVVRLLFAIQTYFSLLLKTAMADLLGAPAAGDAAVVMGDFARERGIENYVCEDCFCWPLFELEGGFGRVMDRVRRQLAPYRVPAGRSRPAGRDDIRLMYEALVPRELRHALGEYYTPDWLAEAALGRALEAHGGEDPAALRVLDPTCGSGTFLLQAIAVKRRAGCGLAALLDTVRGLDINPLAVLTAKTNYLLAVLDLLEEGAAVILPVFRADVLRPPEGAAPPAAPDFIRDPAAAVRSRELADGLRAQALDRADVIAGNPPWVNWEYLPEPYRAGSKHLWEAYGLFSARGPVRSFAKEDISALITYAAMDRFLRRGGVLAFVIRQAVFKSGQNGSGFRRFRIREGEAIQVLLVEDLSALRAFDAAGSAALLLARKGPETVYPVPYRLWRRREGAGLLAPDPCASLEEVLAQVAAEEQLAVPAVGDDPASPWLTAGADRLAAMERVLGSNSYRARTGVFTGGANAVFWLRILSAQGGRVTAANVLDRAKRKVEQVAVPLEGTYLYPMLKGGGIRRWRTAYDAYLLCPHTARTRIRPVPLEDLRREAPLTLDYLLRFREALDSRGGFAGWEKELQRQAFHGVLRVGAYTFAPYKVVWKYIASSFVCAVAGSVDDPFLGRKLLLPNEKVMYVGTDSEEEAYYLCGLLSSTAVADCVRGYMNPTSISAHVLDKLRIPAFDPADPRHAAIAALCREGHGQPDPAPYIAEIDRLAGELYAPPDPGGRPPPPYAP